MNRLLEQDSIGEKVAKPYVLPGTGSITFKTSRVTLSPTTQAPLRAIDETRDEDRHKLIFDELVSNYVKEQNAAVVEGLTRLCIQLGSRKSLRKYIYHKLNTTTIQNGTLFGCLVDYWSRKVFTAISEAGLFQTDVALLLLNFLFMFMQNFGSDTAKFHQFLLQTQDFYFCALDTITNELKREDNAQDTILADCDVQTVLDYSLKHLLTVLAKLPSGVAIKNNLALARLTYTILQHFDKIRFETATKCALLFAYLINYLPEEYKLLSVNKKIPNLDFLDKNDRLFTTPNLKLLLYTSIANSVRPNELETVLIENERLDAFLYRNLLQFGEKMTGQPNHIVLIARTLCELPAPPSHEKTFQAALTFTWAHLDHFIESVIHSTRALFKKILISLAFEPQNAQPIDAIFGTLNAMPNLSKVRLVALDLIAAHLPAAVVAPRAGGLRAGLLGAMRDPDVGPLAGAIYTKLMLKAGQGAAWAGPLLAAARRAPAAAALQRAVAAAAERAPELVFARDRPSGATLMRCVNVARLRGLRLPAPAAPGPHWRRFAPQREMRALLASADEEARLWALQAVAESARTTEVLGEWELAYLGEYLRFNIATQVAAVRKKIGGFYKNVIGRFYASLNVVRRNGLGEVEAYYGRFMEGLIYELVKNLQPDANFSRRYLSLELLLEINEVGGYEAGEWGRFFGLDDVENVKLVLGDGFEANKAMAVRLLACFEPEKVGFGDETSTIAYANACLEAACDLKPARTLTAAYMHQFLLQSPKIADFRCATVRRLVDATSDLSRAPTCARPVHGLLLSLRTLLASRDLREHNAFYAGLFGGLLAQCVRLKAAMMPVVADRAPEGCLPAEADFGEFAGVDTLQARSQLGLVCAWKTMKEVMLLLAELVRQSVCLEAERVMLDEVALRAIGAFFLDVFIESKHRGVFEQAGVAFSIIAHEFTRSKNTQINVLPMEWLNVAISLSTGAQTDERLCATRRSAGLPFLILSIVSAQPAHFAATIGPLLSVGAAHRSDAVRSHSLNVLRFVFQSARLGELVPPHVDAAASAALTAFGSRNFGVRNSATLLYAALMTRMFGVQRTADADHLSAKNRLTVGVFRMRYPKLFGFLLEALARECGRVESLVLHPVLLLLARLCPAHDDEVQKHVTYIGACLKNPSYRTRDLAARASVALIGWPFVSFYLTTNFDRISDKTITDTECHGLLLQCWHLVKTSRINEDLQVDGYLTKSLCLLDQKRRVFSNTTINLYLELVLLLLNKYSVELKTLKKTIKALDAYSMRQTANVIWSKFELVTFILLNKLPQVDTTIRYVVKDTILFIYGPDKRLKRNIRHFYVYLNQVTQNADFCILPIVEGEVVEIPDAIRALVDSFSSQTRNSLLKATHRIFIHYLTGCLQTASVDGASERDEVVLDLMLLYYYVCCFEPAFVRGLYRIVELDGGEETLSVVLCVLGRFHRGAARAGDRAAVGRLLRRAASPSSSNYCRLSAAQFICSVSDEGRGESGALFGFSAGGRCELFSTVMVLLEDDESYVRNTISGLRLAAGEKAAKQVTPYQARLDLVEGFKALLEADAYAGLLTGWACRHLPAVSNDAEALFDRSILNPFAENQPIVEACSKMVAALLFGDLKNVWRKGLLLGVFQRYYETINEFEMPMVGFETKKIVLQAVEKYCYFIKDQSEVSFEEFQKVFSCFFSDHFLPFLKGNLNGDYASVKYHFELVFSDLLS